MIFIAVEQHPSPTLRLGTIDEDNERIVVYRAGSKNDVTQDMLKRGCGDFEVHEAPRNTPSVDVDLVGGMPGRCCPGYRFELLPGGDMKCLGCGALDPYIQPSIMHGGYSA